VLVPRRPDGTLAGPAVAKEFDCGRVALASVLQEAFLFYLVPDTATLFTNPKIRLSTTWPGVSLPVFYKSYTD
jgi:hypothetical protein